jgi:hypothetical protein
MKRVDWLEINVEWVHDWSNRCPKVDQFVKVLGNWKQLPGVKSMK